MPANHIATTIAANLLSDPLTTLDTSDDTIISKPIGSFGADAEVLMRFNAQQEEALDKARVKVENYLYRRNRIANVTFIKNDELSFSVRIETTTF